MPHVQTENASIDVQYIPDLSDVQLNARHIVLWYQSKQDTNNTIANNTYNWR